MFKRLNPAAKPSPPKRFATAQARMLGAGGEKFFDFLRQCAGTADFKACTEPMADSFREKLGDEELVLRFFALKNAMDLYKGNIQDWLDRYLDAVILGERQFDYREEEVGLRSCSAFSTPRFQATAHCVKYKANSPTGALLQRIMRR